MASLTHIFGSGVEGLSDEDAAKRSKRYFVRSEGGLAVYEADRNPTGHVLTAWEAFDTFGLDILEEAIEYGSAILRRTNNATGQALASRREELGLPASSVARAARVSPSDVLTAESFPSRVPFKKLERLSLVLGLDERFLAFKQNPGGDTDLAYRLKTLVTDQTNRSKTVSAGTALLFAEAAAIVRIQLRLQKWLGLPMSSDKFRPDEDYGSPQSPAWKVGYGLAAKTRDALQLHQSPIDSMRSLVETGLGIPVIQAKLPEWIAGATVETTGEDGEEARGIVLNTVGGNENVWIRRATLAHELAHRLYDPKHKLESLRVDSYQDNQRDTEAGGPDFVEQRANAFAIAFLAPNEAVRELVPTPVSEESVSTIMQHFGLSHTAARYHIANCHYRNFDVPSNSLDVGPTDEQMAAENFTIDYFSLPETSVQRRGRFAGLVAKCHEMKIISEDTAALYLGCSTDDFRKASTQILGRVFKLWQRG